MQVKIDLSDIKKIITNMQKDLSEGAIGARAGYYSGDKGKNPDPDNKERPDVSQIALWNEEGTVSIPPRPYIRASQKIADKRIARAIQVKLDEGTDKNTVLKLAGQIMVDIMTDQITHGNWTPNAPITISGGWMQNKQSGKWFYVKGKGSDRPLIDKGNLVDSIHAGLITKTGGDGEQIK